MTAPDPFDGLRRAWGELRAPDPAAPAHDAGERAALRWMRAAWDGLEAPPFAPPLHHPTPRARAAPRWIAAALAALALGAWLALAFRRHAVEPTRDLVQIESPVPAATGAAAGIPGLEVAAVEPGRMELRSGPVRLILLDRWTEEPLEGASAR